MQPILPYIRSPTFWITAVSITILAMAFQTPNFLSRLFRPFATARLGITGDTNGGLSQSIPDGAEKATIAAGCFWGVEHMYRKQFDGKGLYDARVGYIGGDSNNPTYRAVCSGQTGRKLSPFCVFLVDPVGWSWGKEDRWS